MKKILPLVLLLALGLVGMSFGQGVQRSGNTINSLVPGTSATNLGKAEDAASASGDTGVALLGVADATNATQRAADRDYTQFTTDTFGTLLVRRDHPNRIRCTVEVSSAITITAVGGSCAAPGVGLSIYITDISFGSSVASGSTADSFPTLKSGTGGTCGTATAVIWGALSAANTTVVQTFNTPIKVAANSEVCWILTGVGSKFININGFIAP